MRTHIAASQQMYRFTKGTTGATVAQCGAVVDDPAKLSSKKKATCEACQRKVRRR